MRSPARIDGRFLAVLLVASCASQPKAGDRCLGYSPATIVFRDSTLLREDSVSYIANPAAFFVLDHDGTSYIPDAGLNRVLGFGRDGRPTSRYGRVGDGPGEFRAVSPVGLVTGRLLWQGDYRRRRVQVFDLDSGMLTGDWGYRGRLTHLTSTGDTVLVGIVDHSLGLAMTRVARPTAPSSVGADPLAPTEIPLPVEYVEYPRLKEWDDFRIAGWSDTIIAAFGGVDYLVRFVAGRAIDTAWIPVCQRRGTPRALLDRWFRDLPRTAEEENAFRAEAETGISALLGLWRLPNGRLVLWHQDPFFQVREQRRILQGTAFITVIAADFRSACVDAPVPPPSSGRPRLAMAAGRLASLDQDVSEDPGGPTVRS